MDDYDFLDVINEIEASIMEVGELEVEGVSDGSFFL